MSDLLPVANERAAPDLDALRSAVAAVLEQGRAVNIVYAPSTTIHHHTTAGAPVPVAPSVVVVPAAAGGGSGSRHPGIDVDLTGYGEFAPPVFVAPLPAVAESRSWAPMVLLVSGWSGLGGVFAAALTQSAFAVAYVVVALVVFAGAFAAVYRANGGPR
jgi:hypothetical protein